MGRRRADGKRINECKRPYINEYGHKYYAKLFSQNYCRGKSKFEHNGQHCVIALVSNLTGAQSFCSLMIDGKYQTEEEALHYTGVFKSKINALVWFMNYAEKNPLTPTPSPTNLPSVMQEAEDKINNILANQPQCPSEYTNIAPEDRIN